MFRAKWLDQTEADNWTPTCIIVVHASASSYAQAVGRGAAHTSGSSCVEFEKSEVVARRIDLREDQKDGGASALAHEMTHVVLADHFRDSPPPRWADEGASLLADSSEKQKRHHNDLMRVIEGGQRLRVADLVMRDEYPSSEGWAAYYAKSLALTRWLSTRGEPSEFVRFLDTVLSEGYEHALRSHYSIDGLQELERLWQKDVFDRPFSHVYAK